MWAGLDQQREQIRRAGLELAPGELLAAATGRGAQLEGINAVLLLTTEDDFNALASAVLALSDEALSARLEAWRAKRTAEVAERPRDDAQKSETAGQ